MVEALRLRHLHLPPQSDARMGVAVHPLSGGNVNQLDLATLEGLEAENARLKRLLKRTIAPLRYASCMYLDHGMTRHEDKTDTLIDSITRAVTA